MATTWKVEVDWNRDGTYSDLEGEQKCHLTMRFVSSQHVRDRR